VKLEEGLDTFIVIDGLPVVPEANRQKLIKFLLRKLNTVGHTSEDAVFMPINAENMSEGYVPKKIWPIKPSRSAEEG
jgi:translation initiation factor 3 subunit B